MPTCHAICRRFINVHDDCRSRYTASRIAEAATAASDEMGISTHEVDALSTSCRARSGVRPGFPCLGAGLTGIKPATRSRAIGSLWVKLGTPWRSPGSRGCVRTELSGRAGSCSSGARYSVLLGSSLAGRWALGLWGAR